jgi:hypothetical protein
MQSKLIEKSKEKLNWKQKSLNFRYTLKIKFYLTDIYFNNFITIDGQYTLIVDWDY